MTRHNRPRRQLGFLIGALLYDALTCAPLNLPIGITNLLYFVSGAFVAYGWHSVFGKEEQIGK